MEEEESPTRLQAALIAMSQAPSTSADNAQPQRFNEALEAAMAEALPSDDPLDSPDFKAIDYINTVFPTGTGQAAIMQC